MPSPITEWSLNGAIGPLSDHSMLRRMRGGHPADRPAIHAAGAPWIGRGRCADAGGTAADAGGTAADAGGSVRIGRTGADRADWRGSGRTGADAGGRPARFWRLERRRAALSDGPFVTN